MDSAKSFVLLFDFLPFPPLFLSSPSSRWKRSDVSPLYHLTIRRRWERGDAPTSLTYISPDQILGHTQPAHHRTKGIAIPQESEGGNA
ncbi:hypothetical protein CDEST_13765 [Colletotrichum destructivum]|uniref:Uncharacterized protein n=1 Tax=Colletotrichum destructivum TaxID=34406 RepID=A0AAX4IZT7_9PEZI|nr:hypothetical protein CDEST_13765 [Colletotrichum destructivum]